MLLIIAYAAVGFAQEAENGQYDVVAQAVEKRISADKKVRIEHLQVLNKDGGIYLEGVADLYGSRFKAGEYASQTEGVTSVKNQIAVKDHEVSDLEIEGKLFEQIQKHLRPEPFDLVSVKVNHGFVTLLGHVRDVTLIDDAFEEALWTRGVREVENKIQAASVGAGDERLRQTIYLRLRREYPLYFAGRFPSFVILVEHGRVTLIGYVDSAADKMKITTMIRSLHGVLSVDNLLEAK